MFWAAAQAVISTNPSFADDARALADELGDKTYRFEDRDTGAFGRHGVQAWFLYLGEDGFAAVWKPADNQVKRMNWSTKSSTSLRWQVGSRSHSTPLDVCLVEMPVSNGIGLDCRTYPSPPAGKGATIERRVSVCVSPAEPGSFAFALACRSDRAFKAEVTDARPGDVLAISSGRVPCQLCRQDTNFDDVAKTKGDFD